MRSKKELELVVTDRQPAAAPPVEDCAKRGAIGNGNLIMIGQGSKCGSPPRPIKSAVR